MLIQKLGYNVHPIPNLNREKALDILRNQHPQAVVILNDKDFASQCADLGIPYVILRMTNNDDSIHNKLRSFREWWEAVKANYTDKRLIVHFGNEPKSNLQQLTQFSIEGMQTLYAEGHKGIFGNFAVGNPEFQDWKTTLKPLLQALIQYDMYLGLHEYFMGSVYISDPFEIGRFTDVLSLYPQLKIIFTEFGTDFIQDVKIHNAAIKDTTGYKDYDNDKYVFDEIKTCFEKYYNKFKQVLGVCFFSLGDSGGWNKYDAQDYEYLFKHAGELMTELNLDAGIVTTVRSSGDFTVNRRTGPGTNYSINGYINIIPVEVTQLETLGDWVKFRFNDGEYWLNRNYVTIESKANTITLSIYDAPDEDVAKIKAALQELMALLSKYKIEFE